MCGLVAVVSKAFNGFTSRDKDVFSQMLFADTLRGDDATGTMLVDNNGNLDLAKEATTAPWFQGTSEYRDLEVKAVRNGAAWVGHNRKATRGEIKDENAHPFVVDNRIVLVHNGTLYGDHTKIANTEVDSHAIAHLIHQKEDNVEAALSELNGAYALIWYDVKNRELNFVRNDDRPLYYIETNSAWYWASEAGMLAWIMNRNNVPTTPTNKITLLPAGTLFNFKHNGQKWEAEQRKLNLTKSTQADDDLADYYASLTRGHSKWHPYANGYVGGDCEDDCGEVAGLRQQRAQQHRSNVQTITPTAPSTESQKALDKYTMVQGPSEREMCRKAGLITTLEEFQLIAKELVSSAWEKGKMIDYEYVRNGDFKNGLYMYAESTRFPNVAFRQFVPCEPMNLDWERDLIQMAMDETPCMFKLGYKIWHKLDGSNSKEGITMVYTTDYGRISDAINGVNKDESHA